MEGLSNRSCRQPIPPTGLTVVVNPDEPSLDIIFVHGFTGHPERTWTHKKGDGRHKANDDDELAERPSKIRKLNPFSKPRQEDLHTAIYWPRDLIPSTVPNARVLTYGYDTHIRHKLGPPANRNTTYDIAWDFLVALEAERRAEPLRPALFIVHSLGGIVVKEMLRRSGSCYQGQAHLRDIFESTIGIMFFGTPHSGADPRGILQHIAEKVIKAAGFSVNEQIVNTLLPSSERLRELRDEFGPMALEQNWIIHSFQEQLGVALLGDHKVVEDTSSYLNLPTIEISEHIRRNHMEICRFTGLNDVEYKKVASALHRMASSVSSHPKRGEKRPLNEKQKIKLLNSLRFDQMDARQMNIETARAKACKWLLKKSEYLEWLDVTKQSEHHGFLWIKGKPGTGKSTLMKFALANARNVMKVRIVISFFFNARGAYLGKSTIGMYRSILFQLLEQLPELQCVFEYLGIPPLNSTSHQSWSIESLKDLLEQAMQLLGQVSVGCFIDALDECDDGEIRDMVAFFRHLGELAILTHTRFQVLFSSRHYPHIKIETGLSIVLEEQEGHDKDITSYIDNKLKIDHSNLSTQIKAELQEKASGVFMWVVLVVDMLNKEDAEGRSIRRLQKKLKDIPSDLHELFRQILTRDCRNRDELLLCIQWLLFARQPLKPEQLYYAILSGADPEDISKWDPNATSMDTIKKFILNSSKGLAEITKSKMPSAQFIHESVRDFLLKKNGLRDVWPELGSNLQGNCHEQLKHCCLKYMSISITDLNIGNSLPKASSPQAVAQRQSPDKMFPFLEYAVRNVLYHADTAEGSGVSQTSFLRTFQLADWIKLDNLFAGHETRRHTLNASLFYILAENNMGNLIRSHPSNLLWFEVEHERYGAPIFAALAANSGKAVETFLNAQARIEPPTSLLHSLCEQYYHNENKSDFARYFNFLRRRSVLSHLAEYGDEVIILASLLALEKLDINSTDSFGRTPLSWAAGRGHEVVATLLLERGAELETKDTAESGHEAVVTLLLEKGAELETKDKSGRTPLLWAAEGGHEAVAILLLERGAEIETKYFSRTPLSLAAQSGHEAVVTLLLDKGADLETKDSTFDHTPLSLAAKSGHEAVVILLLDKGADLETKDSIFGQTPLSWAAKEGQEAVVKLLLERGAKLETRSNTGQTPLSWAAKDGRKAVVTLLLDKGADLETKDFYGQTPLWWATMTRHKEIATLLLEKATKKS
ncbi:Pfs NB-ARC and Ankyrin domain protein [Rutstroemia sp. NJR-2017a BBW]|nr:Pfs NB-ARC and Ankyrin domain protein [Rutstroemia sp. NJR-2017a BBW]